MAEAESTASLSVGKEAVRTYTFFRGWSVTAAYRRWRLKQPKLSKAGTNPSLIQAKQS